ncbi:hypothetical protein ACFRFQ_21195 [Rhodococcus sp. NPDC056743]|uniref:hypothetical protein n=1 Tax=Rhodococcus sp. NPDC056743 TaxID=3345934 RepID=UPI003670BEAF
MRRRIVGAARVTATVVSGLALAATIGSGTAQADPQDCVVERNVFSAMATCHDTDAPPGREYALIVDCWGIHGIPNAFPFYAIGPYSQSSPSFVPTGRGTGGCSTNWGVPSLNVGVVTNAHVQVYRQ